MTAIRLKRSIVAGKTPVVANLVLGELAVNSFDGKLYTLKNDGTASVVEIGAVSSVAGKTGDIALVKGDVGLGNVNNTSDAAKPISTATQAALDAKQPLDATLTSLSTWTGAVGSDKFLFSTMGGGTVTGVLASTFMLNALSAADAAAARSAFGAAAASHTHAIANITSLQATLDGKAASSHEHVAADVTNLGTAATKNVGTAASNVVQLDANARLPALNASLLTNLNATQVAESLKSLSASYTLTLDDRRTFIMFTGSANVTVTVPANAEVAFALGARITIERNGLGTVTIAGSAYSGVTINSKGTLTVGIRYGVVQLVKTGTDTWVLFGDVG